MDTKFLLEQVRRNWTPPRGLARSRPRQVRLSAGGKALMALAIALVAGGLAAGVGLGWVASRDADESRLFHLESVSTHGVITRLWRARGNQRQPWMAYQFAAEGRTLQRSAKVSLRFWRELQVGTSLPIRYVPSRPEINYPFDFSPKPMPPWLPALIAVALVFGGLLTTLPVRIQRKLLSEGRPAPAIVTKHEDIHRGKAGRKHDKKYHYEFSLLTGATGKGHAGPAKNPPAIGATIIVMYHPEDPRKNVPYPLSLVRLSD
jgi:hypothetical protein